ncbi:HAD-IA family hydrolase [Snodgrassella sp. CS2]|uniref:HAD-IA family hydrolase n=1 Tax=Snodgrassella sp. CS2 TaxID=3418953 RepID=UPI003D01F6B9
MNSTDFQSILTSAQQYYAQNLQNIDQTYINNVLEKSNDFEVISFDIFDTLLTRLFECPIDLFAYVENQLQVNNSNLKDFARNRLLAEAQIRDILHRQKNRDEVTLDEIYDYLFDINKYDKNLLNTAKKLELIAETNSNISIEDNKKLILELKKLGKKIIFVSDIYLSKQFIETLLEKNHLNLCDELYVSSDLLSSKHSGRIWKYVLENNSGYKILHIGDNKVADVVQPRKFHINTYHYKRFLGQRRLGAQLCQEVVPFSLMNKVYHLTNGIYSLKEFNEDSFWNGLGETFGALILYSYTLWLKEHIKKNKINHIYFCARDAQLIQKVWETLDLDKECHTTSSYLYLSRKVLRFPTYYIELIENGKLSEDSLTFIVNESLTANDTYKTYFNRLGINERDLLQTNFVHQFGSFGAAVDFKKTDLIKKFIQQELSSVLLNAFQEEYNNAKEYYKQEGLFDKNKKIAIIDLGWGGTIQFGLNAFRSHMGIDSKLYGYYYGLFGETASGRLFKNGPMKAAFFNIFSNSEERIMYQNCVNILENLHSADHETTTGFIKDQQDGVIRPILKQTNNSLYIQQYEKKFLIFQKGVLHSINKWKNNELVYGLNKCYVGTQIATAAIFQVCITPNKDEVKYLGNIKHATMFDHKITVPLINQRFPSNLKEVQPLLQAGGWQCGVLQYWKDNRKKIKPHVYNSALQFVNFLPSLIKKFYEN